jgi:hypothetical protein
MPFLGEGGEILGWVPAPSRNYKIFTVIFPDRPHLIVRPVETVTIAGVVVSFRVSNPTPLVALHKMTFYQLVKKLPTVWYP